MVAWWWLLVAAAGGFVLGAGVMCAIVSASIADKKEDVCDAK